jgi:glucose/arabinose dehydrogenase
MARRSLRSRFFLAATVLAMAAGAGVPARAQTSIVLEPVLSGLSAPVFVTHAGDGSGRLFVVEQGGTIRVLQNGASSPTLFLDISDRVIAGGEQGLLGLAFHPAYETNRRLFVDYTRRSDGATVIAEYHASAGDRNVADRTETVLLTIPQPFANHNGGMLAFGPDGFLYIGMGDGGSANDPGDRAQNVNELLGKILRLDVDHPASAQQLYSSPADNPFAGATAGRDEIYALGLRNPWRFSFDRQTGDLVAGDVGQSAREEVDVIVRGGNYGWRTWEGTQCTGNDPPPCNPAGFIMPIAEYGHTGSRCSITGGYVYRGSRGSLPAGAYVFGDYCSGEIFLRQAGQFGVILGTGANVSSFGEDQDGEVYVVLYGGTVARIAAPSACSTLAIAPPSLAFPASGGSGAVNVTASAECDWTAASGSPWITVTSGDSGSGDGAVQYRVAGNPGPRARRGSVVIGGRVHAVSQAGPPRCPLEIDPRRIVVGPGGATGSLVVTTRGECTWHASSEEPWVVITSGVSGTGPGVVSYRIDPRPEGPPRRGRIQVGNRATLVRQQ